MNGITVTQSPTPPLLVTQDAIDALKHESAFWSLASEFMLEHGFWKKIEG